MMKAAVALVVVVMVAGCGRGEEQETGNGQRATGNRQPHARMEPDARSQRDLADEIAAAEKLRRDEADAEYRRIRASWVGKRVSWKLDVVPALCRAADACHALAFDRLGADRAVVQGWMPRLRLTAPAFAALQTRCAGRPRCPITVEATVADFTLSRDEPTSLTLGRVSLAM